ncbi:gastrula zinc finger protein XlCGF57.1-like [Mya arenaria]|uniref:gastrula zinc finger protein XlCGF57.1-like n=1 Tax=Mya arenaria TaxID=6604 RepID=UPI0022E703EF|nr:gastrula zinc finger protein XlCGF57.1-like [Mya arenaria]
MMQLNEMVEDGFLPEEISIQSPLLDTTNNNNAVNSMNIDDAFDLDGAALDVANECFQIGDNVDDFDEVNIDNIQLHLECSEDGEATAFSSELYEINCKATSQIKSDTQFKISFPTIVNEGNPLAKCPLCKSVFFSREFLREHVVLNHRDAINLCSFCDYFTKSNKLFATHMRTRHSVLIVDSNNEEVSTNIQIHNMENAQAFQAIISERNHNSTWQEIFLDNHELQQSSSCTDNDSPVEDTGTCTHVSSFTNGDGSQILETSHQMSDVCEQIVENIFKCDNCVYVTHQLRLLKYHMKTMHDSSRKEYQCRQCEYKCKQKKSFDAHLKKHEGIFDFKCNVCDKTFASKHLLTRHSKRHKGSVIGKTSVQDLTIHGKNNSTDNIGDKFGVEKVVEKSTQTVTVKLKTKATLLRNTHSEKTDSSVQRSSDKFKCSFENCGRSFRDKYNMKKHLEIHSGQKSLTCTHCDFRCIQKTSLDYHTRKYHSCNIIKIV